MLPSRIYFARRFTGEAERGGGAASGWEGVRRAATTQAGSRNPQEADLRVGGKRISSKDYHTRNSVSCSSKNRSQMKSGDLLQNFPIPSFASKLCF